MGIHLLPRHLGIEVNPGLNFVVAAAAFLHVRR